MPDYDTRRPHIHVERRITDMRSERSSWLSHWRELTQNFSPRRGKYTETDRNKGSKRNILPNNTPLFAKRVLVSGLMTGVSSPARPWFKLSLSNKELEQFGPVREWLDSVEDMQYRIFAASNLYRALPDVYDELCTVGTAAMLQEENFDDVTRFTTYTAGEFMLDTNGDDRVDTFAREYDATVWQLISEFGLDNVSRRVRDLYDRGAYTSVFRVHHVIEPVTTCKLEGIKLPEWAKWRSIYYEVGAHNDEAQDKMLRVRGYRNFPVFAPRWSARSGDVYGYSPAMDALGDAKALQIQEKEKAKAVAKQNNPPMKAPKSLENVAISLLPGAVNFTEDPNNVFSSLYQVQARPDLLAVDIERTEMRINRAMYADLFLMIARQDDVRTATEIAARQEEKLLQLGPVLEHLHDELLEPLIENTFEMLMNLSEAGWSGMGPMLLPPPPEELQEENVEVEFVSILANAQRLVDTGAMERWIGFVGNMAAIKPEVLDKIDADEAADEMAQKLGVPPRVVVDDEEVSAQREARQQMQQMQAMTGMAQQAVDAAKTLGDTPTTGGNVLNDVLGVGQ